MFKQKKNTVFIHSDAFHTKTINVLIGLAKRSFGNCLQKSTYHKGGKAGCGDSNCAAPSKPFTDRTKTNRENKDRTACLTLSV